MSKPFQDDGRAFATLLNDISSLPLRTRLDRVSAEAEGFFKKRFDGVTGTTARVSVGTESRSLTLFNTCNYLGLSGHPAVLEAARQALQDFGAGACTSAVGARIGLHFELEAELAEWLGVEDAILFSSGFMANLALFGTLLGPNEVVVADRFAHASIVDGVRQRLRPLYFRHNDLDDLGAALSAVPTEKTAVVVVEGLYSIDADVCPLEGIAQEIRKHGAVLVVDEAHSLGTLGVRGRGVQEETGTWGEVTAVVGSLAKALGSAGGFVAGSRKIIDYLRFMARPYMFSTSALSPANAASALQALRILKAEPERVARLRENHGYLLSSLTGRGLNASGVGAIIRIPVPAGINGFRLVADSAKAGFGIARFAFPAAPVGKDAVRLAVSSQHSREDLDRLVEVLASLLLGSGA
ncbi:MAG: aminotransferase class I/II-fold pyridoxal phosphate-dependent enzyme [Myxococcales bacterium]|nr:aminotransferase class I/II-fold pyridoxal phosphate-dependent enzyme [Myxococcales bacterium]